MARVRGFWRRKGRGGRIWYTTDPASKRDVSTGFTDIEAAKAWRARRERECADPTYIATDAASSGLVTVLDTMIAERMRAGRAPSTIGIYQTKARHLVRLLRDVDINALKSTDLSSYIDRRIAEGAARRTVKMELIVLHIAFKLASKRGVYGGRLDRLFPEYPDQYTPRSRWLSADEADKLASALPSERRAAFFFLLYTGARRGEFRRARWEDVAADRVLLRGTKTKQAARDVPLAQRLTDLLDEARPSTLIAGAPIFDRWQNINRDLKKACQAVGIAPVTPNDLRRSFASWLRNAGVDSSTVATLLGHTTTKMVDQVYGRLDFAAKLRAIGTLDSRLLVRMSVLPAPTTKYQEGSIVVEDREGEQSPPRRDATEHLN